MVIVKLMGGLGNQMFQYATARRLAIKTSQQLKLDISHFDIKKLPNDLPYRPFDLSIFQLEFEKASTKELDRFLKNPKGLAERAARKLKNMLSEHQYVLEPHFHFYPELLKLSGNVYLEGYWQCEKYFCEIEDIIRQDFKIKSNHSEEGLMLMEEIKASNSVCLNVRRQEFASGKYPNQFVGLEYIQKGMDLINSKIENPRYFIFSDELSWIKENLPIAENMTIVEEHLYGDKFRNCLDLMQQCKHFLIPNSSFGWWAAWLSTNPNKIVVAPDKWLNDSTKNTQDLIPSNWNRI